MLKIIFVQVLLILTLIAGAQEGLILKPLEQDSTQLGLERQIEYRQLISGQVPENLVMEIPQLPKFDFNEGIYKRYSFDFDNYSFYNFGGGVFSSVALNPFYSPFYGNGAVFSQGAYKLNDKFTIGGFSYGANPVMSAPFPNQGLNKFNTYGSTLFMQYKVSKNFKIETRINVQQGGRYPGF